MSKHTPGPWTADDNDSYSVWSVYGYNNQRLANVFGDSAEADANARLIAAAPELLEACQTFAEWLRREEDGFVAAGKSRDTPEGEAEWREWFYGNITLCGLAQDQARAAIAKATGEQV